MAYAEVLHGPLFLPEPAYDLWVAGRLAEVLGVPDDGTRVEIIGGEIVVSPGPRFGHNGIVYDVQEPFVVGAAIKADFPWRIMQVTDVNLSGLRDGYVPDLIALKAEVFDQLRTQDGTHVLPYQVALAVEGTSSSNAADDRQPGPKRTRLTKWSGYAYEGIPYYLLIDRDPKMQRTTLYGEPDRAKGRYRTSTDWAFGETIALPEPFGVEIPTAAWRAWSE